MKIHNIRLGFATNSSSSHSIIMVPDSHTHFYHSIPSESEGQYNWENFLLITKEEKLAYLTVQLFHNINRVGIPRDWARCIAENITGYRFDPDITDINIDHQSQLLLPRKYYGGYSQISRNRSFTNLELNDEFLDDLTKYIMRDNIFIVGGNDNGDGGESNPVLQDSEQVLGNLHAVYNTNVVARKDRKVWTIFDRREGTKIRLSFEDDVDAGEYKYSTVPELVDIKITDHCPHSCAFCYQNSKVTGTHATKTRINTIFQALSNLEVFEVAIGGGEPTLHPQIIDILELANFYGLVPNLTTMSPGNLDHGKLTDILNLIGGLGVSISTGMNIDELSKLATIYNNRLDYDYKRSVTFQIVLGTNHDWNIRQAMSTIRRLFENPRVLLLGFKHTGRGKNFKVLQNNIIEILEHAKNSNIALSVDTSVVGKYRKELEAFGIPEVLMTENEGTFSMYIDAVENSIAKSSYHKTNIPVKDDGLRIEDWEYAIRANFPFVSHEFLDKL